MLGIIGAMDVEVNSVKEKIENPRKKAAAGTEFVYGSISGCEVVAAKCGPGKVNAALCAQAMIDLFGIDRLINIGVAGSLKENVAIRDVVIANDVVQHDIDITALGEPRGLVSGVNLIKIPADAALSEAISHSAIKTGKKIHRGTVASGDTFVAGGEKKKEIENMFGALCCEMEGGAIAQTAYVNGVAFAILRTVSDGGDENAAIDYPSFKKIAAESSTAILIEFINQQQNYLK